MDDVYAFEYKNTIPMARCVFSVILSILGVCMSFMDGLKEIWDFVSSFLPQSAVPIAIMLLLKRPIQNAITKSVQQAIQYRLDANLEEIRAEFAKESQRLSARLDSEAADIQALRSGALSSSANRSSLLAAKRLEAVEMVWSTVIELRKLLPAAKIMSGIDVEAAVEATHNDRAMKEFFEQLSQTFKIEPPNLLPAALARPFLSSDAARWFNAHQLTLLLPYISLQALKNGVGPKVFKPLQLHKELEKTVPELCQRFSLGERSTFDSIIPYIEDRLLHEFDLMLQGTSADLQSVDAAGEIVKRAREARDLHLGPLNEKQVEILEQIPPSLKKP